MRISRKSVRLCCSRFSIVALAWLFISLSGCATGGKTVLPGALPENSKKPTIGGAKKSSAEVTPVDTASGLQSNEEPTATDADHTLDHGLTPREETGGLTIVAGPGWYRAWFLAGVLMELSAAHIPIREIHASEMSALIAVLFAMDPNEGALAWKLQSLKDECFSFPSKGRFSSFFGESAALDSECIGKSLKHALGSVKLESLRTPVRVASIDKKRSNFVSIKAPLLWLAEGSALQPVLDGLRFPGVMDLGFTEGLSRSDCGLLCIEIDELFPVNRLASEGHRDLLVLNFGAGRGEPVSAQEQGASGPRAYEAALDRLALRTVNASPDASRWMSPFGSGHPAFESARRNDYIYMGRKAARDSLARASVDRQR